MRSEDADSDAESRDESDDARLTDGIGRERQGSEDAQCGESGEEGQLLQRSRFDLTEPREAPAQPGQPPTQVRQQPAEVSQPAGEVSRQRGEQRFPRGLFGPGRGPYPGRSGCRRWRGPLPGRVRLPGRAGAVRRCFAVSHVAIIPLRGPITGLKE